MLVVGMFFYVNLKFTNNLFDKNDFYGHFILSMKIDFIIIFFLYKVRSYAVVKKKYIIRNRFYFATGRLW